MNDVVFEVGREYSTPAELQALFWHAGITPKRSAQEYSGLIYCQKLKKFKSDGPSAYGCQYVIAAFYGRRGRTFLASLHNWAFKHDVHHWLGDESGLTRERSNEILRTGMVNDGFAKGANIVHGFVTRFSGSRTAPWRWGFGWNGKVGLQ